MKLKISPDLDLPEDAFYQPWGILAMRGAGKTNAAAVMAEELFKAGRPFVVVDPVGSWWGLRATKEGKPGGLPIPIFGGDHADVPLEETSGEVLANFVVDERVSCVVDVSALSENAKHRFLADFAGRLFRRNSEPLVVFLEEADDYAPQRVGRGPALATLGAMQRLVKRGRFKGLTPVMVTQRSAAINKDLLTQIENLVVLRTTSPQDRKAIEAWVTYHGQSKELLESLSGLKDGEAWLWSPHTLGSMGRFRFRLRETFDSGATPKSGHRKAATLADVNLDALRGRMDDVKERAKAEDPRELRREIVDLKKQLASRPAEVQVQEVVREVEVKVFDEDDKLRLKEIWEQMIALEVDMEVFAGAIKDVLAEKVAARPQAPKVQVRGSDASTSHEAEKSALPARRAVAAGDGGLSDYARVLLDTMGRRHPMKLTRTQLSTLSGRSKRSSLFAPAVAEIKAAGYAVEHGGHLALTELGIAETAAAGLPEDPAAIQAMWLAKLPAYEASFLRVLLDAGGEWVALVDLAERSGRSMTSSMFSPAIGTLVKLGLAEKDGQAVRAADPLLS